MTMTVQQMKRKKKLSQAFQEALDGLTLEIEKLQTRVDRVFTIGRAEGMNDKEIGKEILETWHISERGDSLMSLDVPALAFKIHSTS
jgi:hypothetical protein